MLRTIRTITSKTLEAFAIKRVQKVIEKLYKENDLHVTYHFQYTKDIVRNGVALAFYDPEVKTITYCLPEMIGDMGYRAHKYARLLASHELGHAVDVSMPSFSTTQKELADLIDSATEYRVAKYYTDEAIKNIMTAEYNAWALGKQFLRANEWKAFDRFNQRNIDRLQSLTKEILDDLSWRFATK